MKTMGRSNRRKIWIAILLSITTICSTTALAMDQGKLSFFGQKQEAFQGEYVQENTEDVVYNCPPYTYSVDCIPGIDFLTGENSSAQEIKEQIDQMIDDVIANRMNTISVTPMMDGKAIYLSKIIPMVEFPVDEDGLPFDPMKYLVTKCKEKVIYIDIKFDASTIYDGKGNKTVIHGLNKDAATGLSEQLKEILKNYTPDNLTITNIQNEDTSEQYALYRNNNNGLTYSEWLKNQTMTAIRMMVSEGRATNKNTRVGVEVESVWAYDTTQTDGFSGQSTQKQSLIDYYFDTVKLANSGMINYMVISTNGSLENMDQPFENIIKWWSTKIDATKCSMYFKVNNGGDMQEDQGWSRPDQVTRMLVKAKEYSQFTGAYFMSLSSLKENKNGSTDILMKYLDGSIEDVSTLFQDLSFYSPKKTTFTTYEDRILFYGVCDPNFEILVNGQPAVTNKSGEFYSEVVLNVGMNTVTFENKGTTIAYRITRKVQLITDVTPSGTIKAMGGSKITVVATAYRGSSVTASLSGCQSVQLTEDSSQQATDSQSVYTTYSGSIQLPPGTTSDRGLGKITVSASNQELNLSENHAGGSVTVLKVPIIEPDASEGTMIRITQANARIYPANTLDTFSSPDLFTQPVGTIDYIVSEPLSYTSGGVTHTYYILKSGVRIENTSFETISDSKTENKMSVDKIVSNGSYTEVVLSTDWAVPFTCEYSPLNYFSKGGDDYYVSSFSADSFSVSFAYTGSGGGNTDCSASPLLSSASWSSNVSGGVNRSVLTFRLSETGAFYGMKSYYNEEGKLVLRFNNKPASSLSGLRIVLDPGHSESEGAINGSIGVREKIINAAICNRTAEILRGMGANVTVSSAVSIGEKRAEAQKLQPQIYISFHQNSGSSTAKGGEAYYFNPFSMPLAKYITDEVASVYSGSGQHSVNRGAKQANFLVTCDSGYAAILVEYGFISNNSEGLFLAKDSTQQAMAEATVRGIIRYLQ